MSKADPSLSKIVSAHLVTGLASATGFSSNNLIAYTKNARIEAAVLIDSAMFSMDPAILNAMQQTVLSLYCAYYLMGVNMSLNVGDVKVIELLDRFSTHRKWYALESYGSPLPHSSMEDITNVLPNASGGNIGLKAVMNEAGVADETGGNFEVETPENERGWDQRPMDLKHTIDVIREASNVAVGKIIEIQLIGEHGQAIRFPVIVGLMPREIASAGLVAIAKHNSADVSWMGRYDAWRSGEIEFLADYLLNQDLIENHRKALMADKTNTLLIGQSKRTASLLATLVKGRASPNEVSAIHIIAKRTAMDMQIAMKAKFDHFHDREKYFEATNSIILVIADPIHERFTLYQRGIEHAKDHTFKDIEHNDKKTNGTDIKGMLEAYKLGNAAVF